MTNGEEVADRARASCTEMVVVAAVVALTSAPRAVGAAPWPRAGLSGSRAMGGGPAVVGRGRRPGRVAEHVGAGAGAVWRGGAEQVGALIGEAALDVGADGGGVARHDRAHQTHRPAGV